MTNTNTNTSNISPVIKVVSIILELIIRSIPIIMIFAPSIFVFIYVLIPEAKEAISHTNYNESCTDYFCFDSFTRGIIFYLYSIYTFTTMILKK